MHLALWIASGLLAFAMLGAGAIKLLTPRVKLMEKMKWAKTWSDGNVKLLGLAEVLGAIGLVVPYGTGILPILTPIAAACLAVLMIGAVKTHLDLKEPALAPGLLALLALFVALGRAGGVS
ncbi:MAG: DoxX family protein [Polyangiaceae bacterium]